MDSNKMFELIRTLPEDQAREIFENIQEGNLRGACLAIMCRNLSHPIGKMILSS